MYVLSIKVRLSKKRTKRAIKLGFEGLLCAIKIGLQNSLFLSEGPEAGIAQNLVKNFSSVPTVTMKAVQCPRK